MDKRVIFAVAGSGKTSHIINNLSYDKKSLIITYTNNNYKTLRRKILRKFDEKWPENILLMRYFTFLYSFCYKPFLSDVVKARGIMFNQEIISSEQVKKRYISADANSFFLSKGRYFYANRLAYYIEKNLLDDVRNRLEIYFDEFVIDEVQDIAGRDFNLFEKLMSARVNMLFVGDFFQHTFDTSRDGQVNKHLFENKETYENLFAKNGVIPDNEILKNSWRCSKSVCDYIRRNLGIDISSNRKDTDDTIIEQVTNCEAIRVIMNDKNIIKLHYKEGAKAGAAHSNWGESKGEDHHIDVCVLMNKKTAKARNEGKLMKLPTSTRNKLYVAITRARGNVYFIDE